MASDMLPPEGDLSKMSTRQLRAELARGLTLTAEVFSRLGMVWAELEKRGEDLSDLRKGLAEWLPLIASGRLAAEVVVTFATRRHLLRALEGLPLEQQRLLAGGAEVEVMAPPPENVVRMPLVRMPQAAVRLVFADGQMRSVAQQRLALRPRQPSPPREDARHYRPRYDRERREVAVGKMRVRLHDLLESVAGTDLPELLHPEEFLVQKVRLSPGEQQALIAAARKMGVSESELARKALRAFGLI